MEYKIHFLRGPLVSQPVIHYAQATKIGKWQDNTSFYENSRMFDKIFLMIYVSERIIVFEIFHSINYYRIF